MSELSRWDQVSQLLAEVSAVAAADREAYLQARTQDSSLRAEVLSLLSVEMPSADLLEQSAMDWCQIDFASADEARIEPRLRVGEMLANRFHIAAFLGRGGMGEVYAAEDHELQERVALKLLHPELASQADFIARFRREIRLARRISSPNVAKVFDLVQEPDHHLGTLHFYVLELLEGETLGARLRRDGALLTSEAVEIARQMAAGLAAVHASGVIHRDFKPANVILTKGRVVVTDFGLAAPIVRETGQASLRTASLLLGTPGYVAPEQWAGKPATIATDVYSFGIVLHEMITGRHPNAEGAKLEGVWGRVVAKCLQMDPEKRWSGPMAAVDALTPEWGSRRRLLLGVGGLMALGGLGATGWMTYRSRRNSMLPPGRLLLVAPIRNSTGDASFDGMTVLLKNQLAQSGHFQLLSDAQLVDVRKRMRLPVAAELDAKQMREIALREGASAVLYGTLSRLSDDYTLRLRLEVLEGHPSFAPATWDHEVTVRGKQELLEAARPAATWVRASVGEVPAEISRRSQAPSKVTTASWEALALFTEAEKHYAADQRQAAVALYREALRVDPDFVQAAFRVADLLLQDGFREESYRLWDRINELLRQNPVTTREAFSIRETYAHDTGQWPLFREICLVRKQYFPEEAQTYAGLGRANSRLGRFEESVAAWTKALELRPGWRMPLIQRAYVYIAMGSLDSIPDEIQKIRELKEFAWADFVEAKYHFCQQRLAKALEIFERLSQSADAYWRGFGPLMAGQIAAELNDIALAKKLWLNSAEADLRHGDTGFRADKLILLGHLAARDGDREAAIRYANAAREAQPGLLLDCRAAAMLACEGMPDRAERILGEWSSPPRYPAHRAAAARARRSFAGEK
ncbi:serine/threonine-protein kinase [Bryobacter aggregatus]|uniref:serine/threonine-protein kinase n=1 Tax=Bryobacter aggregatus TaxID=360054 RepID=UPI0004E243A0|nr:serine/threonine-protein kinase [Bryobacter aggregatus]